MTTNGNVRQEPTTGDAVLGVSALGVLLIDAVLLSMMLALNRSNPDHPFSEIWPIKAFWAVLLLFGLSTGAGIVFRSLGARNGIAGRRFPFINIAARVLLLAMVWPVPLLQWEGWDSGFMATSPYLYPTTLLLLILSLVNLNRHRAVP